MEPQKTAQMMQMTEDAITVFSNQTEEEFVKMEKISEESKRLITFRQYKEDIIKDEIEALIRTHSNMLKEIQSQSKETVSDELAKQKALLENVTSDNDDFRQKVQKNKTDVDTLEKEKRRLTTEKENIEDRTGRILPSIRHDVNLYNYISGIRWQRERKSNEVKGYVSNKKTGVKTFSLDPKRQSQFFISNYLWDLMQPEW